MGQKGKLTMSKPSDPGGPSTDEWLKKLWYIHNGILLSHKKEDIWINANEVDKPRAYCGVK